MKLIVGLGNPGPNYQNTRHNIGFAIIDNYLNSNMSTSPINWQNKFNAKYCELKINNEKVFFLKPTTYMNLSGISVIEIVKYFKIPLKDILVIHDDLDLEIGKFRLKTNSSSGGHNGIKSIIEHLNTKEFARLKIGIGASKTEETKDYVLGTFSKTDQQTLENIYPILNAILTDFLELDIAKLMNKYNGVA